MEETMELNTQNEAYIKEWRKLSKLYEFAVEEIYTKIKILTEEFKIFHNESPV